MQDLLGLAARLGRDPLVVQGPGGNISLKRDGVMWVKASGTWMMEAESRPILIPVDFTAVLDGLAAGDPACETCSSFVRHDLTRSALRPSIETTLHAVMPQKVVVHVHCVETISIACLSDATERLAASLNGLNWTFVPYVRPGASLGRTMVEHLRNGTNILVLGKHGLVVAGDTVDEAAQLRAEVSRRLARGPHSAQYRSGGAAQGSGRRLLPGGRRRIASHSNRPGQSRRGPVRIALSGSCRFSRTRHCRNRGDGDRGGRRAACGASRRAHGRRPRVPVSCCTAQLRRARLRSHAASPT